MFFELSLNQSDGIPGAGIFREVRQGSELRLHREALPKGLKVGVVLLSGSIKMLVSDISGQGGELFDRPSNLVIETDEFLSQVFVKLDRIARHFDHPSS